MQASYGGSKIEPHLPLEGFAMLPALKATADNFENLKAAHPEAMAWYPAVIYNAMVHPLVPMAMRGVLWHQGESNVGGPADHYFHCMQSLIGGWRKVWGLGDFPFYYVMTGPFRDWKKDDLPRHWMAQVASLSIANTGFVVTTDIGDPWDLHPYHKDIVGHRLALWALGNAYGFHDVVCSGPIFKSMKVEGRSINVSFDSIGGGLASRDGGELTHFEIAGPITRSFQPRRQLTGATVRGSKRRRPASNGRAFCMDLAAPQGTGTGHSSQFHQQTRSACRAFQQ